MPVLPLEGDCQELTHVTCLQQGLHTSTKEARCSDMSFFPCVGKSPLAAFYGGRMSTFPKSCPCVPRASSQSTGPCSTYNCKSIELTVSSDFCGSAIPQPKLSLCPIKDSRYFSVSFILFTHKWFLWFCRPFSASHPHIPNACLPALVSRWLHVYVIHLFPTT